MSVKRFKVSKGKSRRMFRKGLRSDSRNVAPPPQRGGYRL